MLQRFILQFAVILTFALAQMGVVTHEVSHLGEYTHSQQDKNAPAEQCEQCLSYAQVGAGLASSTFAFTAFDTVNIAPVIERFTSRTYSQHAYAARAPPQLATS